MKMWIQYELCYEEKFTGITVLTVYVLLCVGVTGYTVIVHRKVKFDTVCTVKNAIRRFLTEGD